MKKILSVAIIATLFYTSVFAKCSDNNQGYSAGYDMTKSYIKENSNEEAYMVSAVMKQACQNSSYAALGAKNIKNMDSYFTGCLNGSRDAYYNKKAEHTCK